MACNSIITIGLSLENADLDRLADALKTLGYSNISKGTLTKKLSWDGGYYLPSEGKISMQGSYTTEEALAGKAQEIVRQYGAELMKFQAEEFGMRVTQISRWEYEIEKP